MLPGMVNYENQTMSVSLVTDKDCSSLQQSDRDWTEAVVTC